MRITAILRLLLSSIVTLIHPIHLDEKPELDYWMLYLDKIFFALSNTFGLIPLKTTKDFSPIQELTVNSFQFFELPFLMMKLGGLVSLLPFSTSHIQTPYQHVLQSTSG